MDILLEAIVETMLQSRRNKRHRVAIFIKIEAEIHVMYQRTRAKEKKSRYRDSQG